MNATNWKSEALESAEEIAEYLKHEITKAVNDYKELNEGIRDEDEAIDEVWADIERGEILAQSASDSADGVFIYDDDESIRDAKRAIRELGNNEDTREMGASEANARATELYAEAVYSYLEDAIKEKIKETINK